MPGLGQASSFIPVLCRDLGCEPKPWAAQTTRSCCNEVLQRGCATRWVPYLLLRLQVGDEMAALPAAAGAVVPGRVDKGDVFTAFTAFAVATRLKDRPQQVGWGVSGLRVGLLTACTAFAVATRLKGRPAAGGLLKGRPAAQVQASSRPGCPIIRKCAKGCVGHTGHMAKPYTLKP
jgi:hypothetical protein